MFNPSDLTLRLASAESNPAMGDDAWAKTATHYRATFRYQGRRMTVPFSTGSAWTSPPTVADVLNSLVTDARDADEPFDDWCAIYGYDSDSRRAERIYKAVQRQTRQLRRLLGDDYDAALAADWDEVAP